MSNLLEIERVSKTFDGRTPVLDDVSMTVERGEVACLLGRSGSGKTTLLRCVNHLETIDEGIIWLDGESVGHELHNGKLHPRRQGEICRMRSHVGMVFQHFNLFPHRTALENVTEGPRKVRRMSGGAAHDLGSELLDRVGMSDKRGAYPTHLSGGQQQRVAIARALAMEPKLILFDEPTSALDPELVGEVLNVIGQLARDGMTMVIVTHELVFAREVADKAVFMDAGKVVESGPPRQLIDDPEHERLQSFVAVHNQ